MTTTAQRNNVNAVGAGIFGAMLGAAFVYFSDTKHQREVKEKIHELQQNLNKTLNTWFETADDARENMNNKVEDINKEVSEKARDILDKK